MQYHLPDEPHFPTPHSALSKEEESLLCKLIIHFLTQFGCIVCFQVHTPLNAVYVYNQQLYLAL